MYKKILVPVDGSDTSRCGLSEAIKLAKATGASLRLVHVVNEFIMDTSYAPVLYDEKLIAALREGGRKILAEAEALVREQGVSFDSELISGVGGRVATDIIKMAAQWPADLIVIGTHGRRGLQRLVMGSDAELVLRSSPVPVLMVRGAPEAT